MSTQPAGDVTLILAQLRQGDGREVLDRLFQAVYEELRALARAQLRRERPDHSLQATALVNEAYMRLLAAHRPPPNDRRHFFAVAAQAMRRILIEYARRRGRLKRGGHPIRVTLGNVDDESNVPIEDLLALDEAIRQLQQQDTRMAEIVQLRFFAGFSIEEVAQALDTSERTVKREWAVARAWLYQALDDSR
jgi:RNA polymerase sigma factor (TIGR02999 family)